MPTKVLVFISCGQFTEAERRLGRQISELVESVAGLEPFFADTVQDLNGLDDNILKALRDCAGFIVVMHPRGSVSRPDKSTVNRASVWIEQEIAIATYIQRIEGRKIRIAAFKHVDVGREGLRELLHLNPMEFEDERDVLVALAGQLAGWRNLDSGGIHVELRSAPLRLQDGHHIQELSLWAVNDSHERMDSYDFEIQIPEGLLKHFDAKYLSEVKGCPEPNYRCFRFSHEGHGPVLPRDSYCLATFEYCSECGISHHASLKVNVSEVPIRARMWVGGQEFSVQRNLREMALDAASGVAKR